MGRRAPVNWFPGADDSWLIVASAAGAPKHPAWYYNIAANPDNVWIETTQGKVAVTGEQLQGPQRDDAWHQITSASTLFARYQKKTDRELPVIRLVRRTGS
jgi:deazaflavin-dependent oxidoreductase (nitroreductase family)